MKFYELVYLFENTKNMKQSFEIFEEYIEECEEHQLDMISYNKDMAINFPLFKEIMNIPYIKTVFKYPNLAFFNSKIINEMQNSRAQIKQDYSISFDVNTATYLHDYMTLGKDKVPKEFLKTLSFILDKNLNIDPMFYILENISKGEDSQRFHDNLVSLKKLMTCDMEYYKNTKKIKSILSDDEAKKESEKDLNAIKTEFNELIKITQKNHLIMKVILLAITISRFKYKSNLKQQLEYLIKFMDNKLHTIFLRELSVALEYFEKKQLKFFNPLNNRESLDKTINSIENMAWDFTLVRTLEMYFSSKPDPKADFFIPFIYTHDKGLLDVIEIFDCKDFLIFHKEKRTVPIPINSLMPKIKKYKLDKFFTEEALLNRFNDVNINYEIVLDELKIEIKKIFKL